VASGTDLAKLYIDTLNDEGADPLEIHFVRISKLYQLIPCDNIDKPMYLSTSLKWSSNGAPHGHPRLHQHIAYGLWQMKNTQKQDNISSRVVMVKDVDKCW